MYLWLIIATFITAIYGFNLSVRSDMMSLYVEPQAQVVATKLYIQHKAAQKYLSKHRNDGPNYRPTYTTGEIRSATLRGYLPHGFNSNSGLTSYTTAVYCLDYTSSTAGNDVTGLPAGCVPGSTASATNCCAAPGAKTYLISYGCVPSKWMDVQTGKPGAMLLNAMKDTYGFSNGFGYAVNATDFPNHAAIASLNTTMGIITHGGSVITGGTVTPDADADPSAPVEEKTKAVGYYYPVPQYIIDNDLPGLTNSFSSVCASGTAAGGGLVASKCDFCLVYMTPF